MFKEKMEAPGARYGLNCCVAGTPYAKTQYMKYYDLIKGKLNSQKPTPAGSFGTIQSNGTNSPDLSDMIK